MDVKRYSHADAVNIREMILDMHDAAYRDESDTFHSRERFSEFFDHWSSKVEWSCVVGFVDSSPVGFAYGSSFDSGGWWQGSERPGTVGPDATVFGLSDLTVVQSWRKTGVSARLHDAVINSRGSDVATLLVDTEHTKVSALYERWGYEKVGEQKPFEDSPIFAIMVKRLRP
ncbi:GNAT family N-acetyltransferase [Streptomyces zagrosensis]|uniref:Ribosomal protein S18 acetylase RimI-like enzyme n=1 Tax=Streptomyces zagrosensis TaxID=1042984 RepID=A0A7W9QBF0_9ACTN|nr:GNAT family N-acetyltransferase [Streptomyces zagrosensis]MBB5937085.1 ribosomal protein S18 acetylase RimI-like enzyme [Streptomyces zagrosensis]